VLLLLLLGCTPLLPAFPNPLAQALLSGSRGLMCFLLFFQYVSFYFIKETRFSLLISFTFGLLSFGYMIILTKYFLAHQDIASNAGDIMRISGLVIMLIAYMIG
jgi:hypothetical protein